MTLPGVQRLFFDPSATLGSDHVNSPQNSGWLAWVVSFVFLSVLANTSAYADLRLIIAPIPRAGETTLTPAQDRIATVVDVLGGEVLFHSETSGQLLVLIDESTTGTLEDILNIEPASIGTFSTVQLACNGWTQACEDTLLNVEILVNSSQLDAVKTFIVSAGGILGIEGSGAEVVLFARVPQTILSNLDSQDGVKDLRFQVPGGIPGQGTPLFLGEANRFGENGDSPHFLPRKTSFFVLGTSQTAEKNEDCPRFTVPLTSTRCPLRSCH